MFVCLAAGRGERMKPLTKYIHKAMIPFSGLPFLAYSLLSVPRSSDVVIVVNYFSEQIVSYFGKYYEGRNIQYLRQENPKGTGDALFQFSQAYHPKQPIIVWQADQMIFPDELEILCNANPNAAICSDLNQVVLDLGFWKIKPSSLANLKSHFDGPEYRALPVLEKEGLNQIKVKRQKFEISYGGLDQLETQCKLFKQKFRIGFH